MDSLCSLLSHTITECLLCAGTVLGTGASPCLKKIGDRSRALEERAWEARRASRRRRSLS